MMGSHSGGAEMRWRAFTILVLVGALWAQHHTTSATSPGRVEHQLRLTDEKLSQVEALVDECAPLEARQLIQQARALQQQAWEEFEGGNLVQARLLTERVRTLLQSAKAALVRKATSAEKRVWRLLERTRRLAERLGPRITSSGDEEAREILDRALRLCSDAEERLNAGDIIVAGRFARQAQAMLKKLAAVAVDSADEAKVAALMERVEGMLDKVRRVNPAAPTDAAESLLEDAEKAFERGDYRLCAKLALQAKRALQSALGSSGAAGEDIRRQIERLRTRLDGLSSKDAEAASQVEAWLSDAEAALERGDVAQAKALLSSAKDAVAQLVGSSEGGLSREAVERALAMTDRLIEKTHPKTDAGKKLLQKAQKLQEAAREDLEGGNLADALDKTRVARELAKSAAEK